MRLLRAASHFVFYCAFGATTCFGNSGGGGRWRWGSLRERVLFKMLCSRFRSSQVSFANASILSLLPHSPLRTLNQ